MSMILDKNEMKEKEKEEEETSFNFIYFPASQKTLTKD
jgi:hypothetical protein